MSVELGQKMLFAPNREIVPSSDELVGMREIDGCPFIYLKVTLGRVKSKMAPRFLKKGYPNRKGCGRFSIRKKITLSLYPLKLHCTYTK